MRRLIAHRGLLDGPNPSLENKYDTLRIARQQGFDVEIDVRYHEGDLWVGHDEPEYKITTGQLQSLAFDVNDNECHVWIHCKNILALSAFANLSSYKFNCFAHDNDDAVLTSNGLIWTYPGKQLVGTSICVLPETTYALWEMPNIWCFGFCSDRVRTLREIFYPTAFSPSNKGW